MEADIHIIGATYTGLAALAVVSAQAVPSTSEENWHPLWTALSFGLRDQACGDGRHQALRRDWAGEWWWGPCVPNNDLAPPLFGRLSGLSAESHSDFLSSVIWRCSTRTSIACPRGLAHNVHPRFALHRHGQYRAVWAQFRSENDAVIIGNAPNVAYGYFLDTITYFLDILI